MKRALVIATFIYWLLGIGFGAYSVLRFENTPGTVRNPPQHWLHESKIPCNPKLPTLIMFAHPSCPCTHASLAELNILLTKCPGKVTAYVLFLTPREQPQHWQDTGLRREAAAIPSLNVRDDPGGAEARRFNATTSGETLLFAPGGHLLFHGGLTGSRGHEGGQAGVETVISLLNTGHSDRNASAVFGCPLAASYVTMMQERMQQCHQSHPH